MSKRVLVFESDANFAASLKENFEEMGATVDVFSDGDEGISEALSNKPELPVRIMEAIRSGCARAYKMAICPPSELPNTCTLS